MKNFLKDLLKDIILELKDEIITDVKELLENLITKIDNNE